MEKVRTGHHNLVIQLLLQHEHGVTRILTLQPTIYHCWSTQKTFREEKFTPLKWKFVEGKMLGKTGRTGMSRDTFILIAWTREKSPLQNQRIIWEYCCYFNSLIVIELLVPCIYHRLDTFRQLVNVDSK